MVFGFGFVVGFLEIYTGRTEDWKDAFVGEEDEGARVHDSVGAGD